ncbi:Transcription factor tipo AP2/ERF [Abeliophyllum distichum]|uniref:Transcription factor tipo AP2/ERF n=1 Tax=Abeliophyllum distichum TaxID=126358 RepID=A0ABD1PQS9_9LAMI
MQMCTENAAGLERDEVDFEFLGNRSGKPYLLQANVYMNGTGGREMRHSLWFSPPLKITTPIPFFGTIIRLCTQEEATEAYDIAAIKFRGLNAVTNFEISRYDVKSILESSTLPIGGASKRLKDARNAEMALDIQRKANNGNHNSH